MRLMKISRANSLMVNLLHSASYAMVCGYIIMMVIWLIYDMRLSIIQCFDIWILAIISIFVGLGTVSAFIDIMKNVELDELARHRLTMGYDDEYYRKLAEFSRVNDSGSGTIFMASMYLEGGRFEDCRAKLREIDFKELTGSEQDEYFNVCLYSAILEGNRELANDIYRKAQRYFDRAVMGKRSGFILHTLGILCLMNGRTENAFRLFQSAMRQNDDGLQCECCIGLGKVYLISGDKASAKDMCYAAAELVETRAQAVRLKELMIEVEEAYGRPHDTDTTIKETT